MLNNGWYWSGQGHEVMAYPVVGWKVRCRWDELPSGRWALNLTVEEEDPAPWIPEEVPDPVRVSVRPVIDGHRSWACPSPVVMEEMSRRAGLRRMRQIVACCRSHEGSTYERGVGHDH